MYKYFIMYRKIFLIITAVLFLSSCQKWFFYPQKGLMYNPSICKAQPRDIVVETEKGGILHGWYFKSMTGSKGTIIFLHGNSRNISTETEQMLWVLEKGYNLLVFDYRGYGISKGKPSIEGVLYDGLEFIDAIMKDEGIDKKNLVIHGQSLGGAVASHVARFSPHANKFKVLVMDSTFTSWRNIAKEVASKNFFTWMWQYPIYWDMPKDLSSTENLKQSKIPNTLIIHSKVDKLVGYSNAETLFYSAKEKKKLLNDDFSAHARIMQNPRIRKEYIEYLDSVLKRTGEK